MRNAAQAAESKGLNSSGPIFWTVDNKKDTVVTQKATVANVRLAEGIPVESFIHIQPGFGVEGSCCSVAWFTSCDLSSAMLVNS